MRSQMPYHIRQQQIWFPPQVQIGSACAGLTVLTCIASWLPPASSSLDAAHALCLQEQSLVDIEMPGQHVSGDEPVPDSTVYVERISSSVVVVRRHSSSFRRLGFIGSDGRTRFFIVQVGLADGDLLCLGCRTQQQGRHQVCCLSCVMCELAGVDAPPHMQQSLWGVACSSGVGLDLHICH